jgi:hypothetical protein
MTGIPAVIVAAIVSLLAHFAVGAAKSLITIRSWWASGFEMTWIGALEGVVTYIIGIALGKIGGNRQAYEDTHERNLSVPQEWIAIQGDYIAQITLSSINYPLQ